MLGSGLDKKDEREFGKLERQVTGQWKFDGIYTAREVNDGKKDVGKEVDTYTQAEQGVDNGIAGIEFH